MSTAVAENVQVQRMSSPLHKHAQVTEVAPGKTLAALVPVSSLPMVCLVNGEPVLHADWEVVEPEAGDVVVFQSVIQGGGDGGSDVLRIVLTIAVIVVAAWAAAAFAAGAAASLTAALGTTVTTFQAASLIQAGVVLVGNLLINAFLPAPKLGAASGQSATQSSVYNVSLQGNQAKLGDIMPLIYGEHMTFPDFASQPYSEFDNETNDQYYHALFCIGLGTYEIDAEKEVFLDDTIITHFNDVQVKILQPGQMPTLVNPCVVNSIEVSGQTMNYGEYVGPFTMTSGGMLANKIGIDIVFPRGLGKSEVNGTTSDVTVKWIVEKRPVNRKGLPQGPWTLLGQEEYTEDKIEPVRLTYTYDVPPGRYEVRVQRQTKFIEDNSTSNEISWAAARGYLAETATLNKHATYMEVRMRASEQLNGTSQRRFSVLAKRKVRMWHPDTGWSAPVVSRSIAWAAADVLKNTAYGAGLDDQRIDLHTLYYLDEVWKLRQDYFDFVFDSRYTVWAALALILRCGRATRFMRGGVFSFVRDEPVALPVAIFTPQRINKNTLTIEYLMPTEETPDGLDVTYYDHDTWNYDYFTVPTIGKTEDQIENPTEFSIPGITGREHIEREVRYQIAADRYRRRIATFETELEGAIPTYGDLIGIGHDVCRWGEAVGEVVEVLDSNTVRLSQPVTSRGYVTFTDRFGEALGPYQCTPAGDGGYLMNVSVPEDEENLVANLDEQLRVDLKRDLPTFVFGTVKNTMRLARCLAVRPNGMHNMQIMAVLEDDRVHTADAFVPKPPTDDRTGYGGYAPDEIPTYANASPEQRKRYAFYAGDDGRIADNEDPYLYQPDAE